MTTTEQIARVAAIAGAGFLFMATGTLLARHMEKNRKPAAGNLDRQLENALQSTFPASDPFSVGNTTSTEPPVARVDRSPPAIDTKLVHRLAHRRDGAD